jgi:hypothetical protein
MAYDRLMSLLQRQQQQKQQFSSLIKNALAPHQNDGQQFNNIK